ncbi:MAG: histidine phosphatase family protein [Pseudomonadota bacterium]
MRTSAEQLLPEKQAPLRLAVLRHWPSKWNEAGRLQGRTDLPISAGSRLELQELALPECVAGWPCVTSPLLRARMTAEIVIRARACIDPRLIELDFGMWEGQRLADLRARDPVSMAANEQKGLDMQPPGGETPRELWHRLQDFLDERARIAAPRSWFLVSHKSVIRVCLAMALDWDMRGACPIRLDWKGVHLFTWQHGQLALKAHSLPMIAYKA